MGKLFTFCDCLLNPRVGEPDGLPSMGSHRVGHDWSDLAAAAAARRMSAIALKLKIDTSPREKKEQELWVKLYPDKYLLCHLWKQESDGYSWLYSLEDNSWEKGIASRELLIFFLWDFAEVLVAHLCPTLCNPMDCSLPGSSVHGVLQARIQEWVVILFSRGSSQHRDQIQVSCIAGRFFTIRATRKALKREVKSWSDFYVSRF